MKILYEFPSSVDFLMIFCNKEPVDSKEPEDSKDSGTKSVDDSNYDLKFDKIVEIVFGRNVRLSESASEEEKLKLKKYYYNIPEEITDIKKALEEKMKEVTDESIEVEEYNGLLDLKHFDSFFKNVYNKEPKETEHYILFSAGDIFPFTFYMLIPDIISKYKLIPHPFMVDNTNESLMNDSDAFTKIKDISTKIFEHTSGNTMDEAFIEIVTSNDDFVNVKYLASQAAITDLEILLFGESGTGKELFAKAIHNKSGRKGEFVAINCAGFSESLLDSELFGHERGAFTGAYKQTNGIFEIAKGGTVLLDEVADMPLTTQIKLLRTLESKTIRRVGGVKEIPIDTRIISATNKDMYEEVEIKNFRQDLYFRLKKFELTIPPLRERGDLDISFILLKVCNERNFPVTKITKSAARMLYDYDFPGNVRELISIIESAIIYSKTYKKDIDDDIIKKSIGLKIYQNYEARKIGIRQIGDEKIRHERYKYIMEQFIGNVHFYEGFNMKEFLNEVDKHYIQESLRNYKTQTEAGKALGYTQQVMSNKITKYNIDNRQIL